MHIHLLTSSSEKALRKNRSLHRAVQNELILELKATNREDRTNTCVRGNREYGWDNYGMAYKVCRKIQDAEKQSRKGTGEIKALIKFPDEKHFNSVKKTRKYKVTTIKPVFYFLFCQLILINFKFQNDLMSPCCNYLGYFFLPSADIG